MTKIRQPVSRNAQVDTRAGWRREKKERKSEIVMKKKKRKEGNPQNRDKHMKIGHEYVLGIDKNSEPARGKRGGAR